MLQGRSDYKTIMRYAFDESIRRHFAEYLPVPALGVQSIRQRLLESRQQVLDSVNHVQSRCMSALNDVQHRRPRTVEALSSECRKIRLKHPPHSFRRGISQEADRTMRRARGRQPLLKTRLVRQCYPSSGAEVLPMFLASSGRKLNHRQQSFWS